MFMTGVDLAGALVDLISTMMVGMLLEDGDGALNRYKLDQRFPHL